GSQHLQPLRESSSAAPCVPELRLLRRRGNRSASPGLIPNPDPTRSVMATIPHIGIDAMGGDFGPAVVVEGIQLAAREMPGRFRITLVGDEAEIAPLLRAATLRDVSVDIVHAPDKVDMAEKGVAAARKSRSSL